MPVITPSIPSLLVVAGGSTVVKTDFPVTRIAVTNPDVADATVRNGAAEDAANELPG